MKYWAELDSDNRVIRVTVGDGDDGGYAWLMEFLGGRWLETSFDTRLGVHKSGGEAFRGNYAGVGWFYDEALDAFVAPPPYPSWVLDESTFSWDAPTVKPAGDYRWDEETTEWVAV
jgi:hypothetical protein